MDRGSFSYDETFLFKRELEFIKMEEAEHFDGQLLFYRDPETSETYVLSLTAGYRQESLTLKEMPENSPVNRFWITFPADPSEHIYGTGETFSEWDLKGLKVRIFTAEHQNAKRIEAKREREKREGKDPDHTLPFSEYESYYVQPTFVSSDKYFVFADTSRFMMFDFEKPEETTLYLQEPPRIIMHEEESFPELSKALRDLLGGQRKLPDWVYDGAIMAVQRGAREVERKIRILKEAGVRTAAIWSQDWCGCRNNTFGYQVMWNWRYDTDLYPDLPEKIKAWREEGIRFLGYINPFIALDRELYKEASDKGYLVKDREGKDYLVTITVFPAAMIDFTNPAAYEWYKSLIRKNMIGIGLSGWMADFGEYLPTDAVLFNGEPAEVWHNRWPAIWAKMNREVIEECGMEDEVFFFMRAGFTGSLQNTLMMWTGDQHVDWSKDDGLPSVIPATLSLAMSGFGMAHSDAGGYTTNDSMKRTKELLMRWEEMNVFSPVLRFHEGNQPWNNVQFDGDEELLSHLRMCTELHVLLRPYLKKLEKELVTEALPVMRPLFYHYDEEEAYTIKDEYLLGRDMLVAPVIEEGAVSRTVYLPEDEWTELFTDETYTGGHYEISAPLGRIPVFIRKAGGLGFLVRHVMQLAVIY